MATYQWDVFISHAEENHNVVTPLVDMLRFDYHLAVWYDDDETLMGGSLRKSIDIGLRGSRCGVAIVSRDFISKAEGGSLIEKEFDALIDKDQSADENVFFPVWFKVKEKEVQEFSPILKTIYAFHLPDDETRSIAHIANQLAQQIIKSRPAEKADRFGEMQQIEAVNKMGKVGFEILIRLLDDVDVGIHVAAIRSLGESRDVRALEPILQSVRQIRAADIDQIRANKDDYLLLITATEALTLIGAKAVLKLISSLRDAYWLVRWVALTVLWKQNDPLATLPVITMLHDEHINIRRDAANVLGDIGDSQALEPLNIALQDPDQKVSANAKEALSKIVSRSSAPKTQGTQEMINQQNRRALYSEMISAAEELVIRLENVVVETGLNEVNESYFRSTCKLEKMENKPIRFDVYELLRKSDPLSYHQLSDAREIEKIYVDLKLAIEKLDSFRHTPYNRKEGLQELDNVIQAVMSSIILIDREVNKNAPILQQMDNGKYMERWRKLQKNFEMYYKLKRLESRPNK
jgi:hypothetical protein